MESERRKLVVQEIRHQEEAARHAKAVGQAQQGQWTIWEGIEKRKISWKDLWEMEAGRISFLLRATYDVLPSPKNLQQWLGEDPSSSATLRDILTGCKVSLSQGRYTWRHNQVLKCLAAAIELKRISTNSTPLITSTKDMLFIQAGEQGWRRATSLVKIGRLEGARDWKMLTDVGQRLTVPAEIVTTTQRPDLVLWSDALKSVYFIEPTVPWEDATEEANERKRLRYAEMADDAQQRGWKVSVCPVEIGCRGFVATSTVKLLKELGILGQTLRQTIKQVSDSAEYCSRWLWLRRKDLSWAPKG